MKKICMTLLGFFAFSSCLFAQGDISRSIWKSGEIIIDGNDKEWTKPQNFFEQKNGLIYIISNDKDHLYFDISVSDKMKMMKMMGSGWSLELISKEKNKKFKLSLVFPAQKMIQIMNMSNRGKRENKPNEDILIKLYQSQLSSVMAKGFKTTRGELPLTNKRGIKIGIGENQDQQLVYEIAIPLNELLPDESIQLNELMSLNININAMEMPSAGGNVGGRPEGGMPEGAGGRSGGGMSRGGGGRSGGGMRQGGFNKSNSPGEGGNMFEKITIKQKFVLSRN